MLAREGRDKRNTRIIGRFCRCLCSLFGTSGDSLDILFRDKTIQVESDLILGGFVEVAVIG